MFILKPTLTEEETVAQIEAIKAIVEKMVEKSLQAKKFWSKRIGL